MAEVPAKDLNNSNRDLIDRGSKDPTPFGSAVFIGSRALEPLWQYQVLRHGVGSSLITLLGGSIIPSSPASSTGIALVDNLGLSPHRLVLLAMSFGAMAKQNYWQAFLSGEPMPAAPAIAIGIFNLACNTFNTLFFLTTKTSTAVGDESTFPVPVLIGSAMFVLGISLEWISEIQRKNFKIDPSSKGKAYTGGLWAFARHINYGGYSLWRSGFAMAGGGYLWGACVGGFFLWDFTNRAIPILDEYCSKRYGEQWAAFKRRTPYQILPYIY